MAIEPIGAAVETVGTGARRRLAGFARTLRENGFKVGLGETRDALAVLVSPAAVRRSSLKPALRALFAATRSDWERFDEVFDAYWSGRGIRRAQVANASAAGGAAALRHPT
ncbi:MAG: carbon monoxide dehydrogenase, partial [Xanthobacteraceae bacterium]